MVQFIFGISSVRVYKYVLILIYYFYTKAYFKVFLTNAKRLGPSSVTLKVVSPQKVVETEVCRNI
jgi:hypothetical protein